MNFGKLVAFGQIGCIWPKGGCIWAKVVVAGKLVIFEQIGCIWAKLF